MIEYRGENYRLWWDENHQIARGSVSGQLAEPDAEVFSRVIQEMHLQHGEVDWLIDLKDAGKAPSSKARKILAEAMASVDSGTFIFTGASILLRTLANFLAHASGKTNIRHFATNEEAFTWLEDRQNTEVTHA